MERPFNFKTELQLYWDRLKVYTATSKHEVNELYHAYKDQHLKAEKDKRKQLEYLVKNGKSILTEAKNDWENLTIVKKQREPDRKSDKAHGAWQETWGHAEELLVDMGFEGYLAMLMDYDSTASETPVSRSIRFSLL
jgi:hypothetical protein